MNYLESIALTRTLPCLAEPGKIIVIGTPNRSLSEVIPYLATLPSVIAYNPNTNTLTFRRQPGLLTLYAEKVYITQVANVEEGLHLLNSLVEAINTTWTHRSELVPIKTAKRAPTWLDVYTMLPQSNCKKCGEATCMAFAVALLQQKRKISECFPLGSDTALKDRLATLNAML